MKDFSRTLARVISFVFHPLWVPAFAFISVSYIGDPLQLRIPLHAQHWVALLVFIVSGLIPAVIMFLMLRLNLISSLSMPLKEERTFPILITAVFFYLTYYLLHKLTVAPLFGFYMLGATTLAIVCLLINLWWKISLHLTAFGGFFGASIGLAILLNAHFVYLAIFVALIAGIVGYSRIKLNAHQPMQIYAGFGLGMLSMFLLFDFFH